MKEVTLPSGAILKIGLAPFVDGRNLYQALAEEVKDLTLNPADDVDVNLLKNIVCVGMASKKLEAAITKCMEKSLYNEKRITNDTWEPVECRGDYLNACLEVAKENVMPFMKSLYAQYSTVLETLRKGLV